MLSSTRRFLLMSVLALFAVTGALPATATEPGARPSLSADAPDNSAAGRVAHLIKDGAWTQFTAPTVLATPKATYVGSISSTGAVQITRISHSNAHIEHRILRKRLEADDHAAPSLLRLADGRIAAVYSGHGTSPIYYRVSKYADSVAYFGPEQVLTGSGMESMKVTYSHILYLPGQSTQKYWLITRGKDYTYWITSSADMVRWTRAFQIMDDTFPQGNHPYARFVTDGDKTVHFAMDEGHSSHTAKNSLYHMYFRNGVFYRSDGTRIRTAAQVRGSATRAPRPIKVQEGTLVHDGAGDKGKSRVFDMALLADGSPVIANMSIAPTNKRYINWMTPAGTTWRSSTVAESPGWISGVALSHFDPHLVYVTAARPPDVGIQVTRYQTADAGQTWTDTTIAPNVEHQRVITTPWGDESPLGAVWMRGRYTRWNKGGYLTKLMAWTRGFKPRTIRAGFTASPKEAGYAFVRSREGWDGPMLGGVRISQQYRIGGKWVTKAAKHTTTSANATTELPVGTVKFKIWRPRGADAVRFYTMRAGEWGMAVTPASRLG